MSFINRLSLAGKAFISPRSFEFQGYERKYLTVLNNFGFGEKTIKKTIDEGYASNTHVFSIINRIAETAMDIPIIITATRGDETEIVTNGEFYNFVHKPNDEDNWKDWIYQAMVYQLASGNSFQYGIKSILSNVITERWMLAPQYIDIKHENLVTGPKATAYSYNYSGKEYKFDVEEILHIKKFNPDPGSPYPILGLSPLQAAWRTLEASNETITADASLIKNKGAFGFLSATGNRPVTKEEAKEFDNALKRKIGGGQKYGSFPITNGQYDFIKFAMSPQDLQILENGVMKLRDLCSVYGVSSRMFNDPNGTTFNNSKEDGKKFYTQGVLPPLEKEIDKFNDYYVPAWNERDQVEYKIQLDTSNIEPLQEDQAKQMVKARTSNTIIQNILKGIGTDWSEESARVQLQDALPHLNESQIDTLLSNKPNNNESNNEE